MTTLAELTKELVEDSGTTVTDAARHVRECVERFGYTSWDANSVLSDDELQSVRDTFKPDDHAWETNEPVYQSDGSKGAPAAAPKSARKRAPRKAPAKRALR